MRTVWNRWKKQIISVLAGLLLYAAGAVLQSDGDLTAGYLERSSYGDEPVVYDLTIWGLSDEPLDYQVEIQPQQYDAETVEHVFDQIVQILPQQILGENQSLSEVRTDLKLPGEFEEYGVRVNWFSEDPDVLSSSGRIQLRDCPEEGVEVGLVAELTDGIHKRETVLTVRVCPELLSEEQKLLDEFYKLIRDADVSSPESETVELPGEFGGRSLEYRQKQSKDYAWFPALGILMAVLFKVKEKKDIEEKEKQRSRMLLLEYADVVYQLMVFIGAGLTVGRAWEMIVKNYEARREENRCAASPAYEEMAAAYRRMQCGESEGKAIAEFGRRCKLQCYLKLSTLLEQNRRTGTKDLQLILEQEMVSAWEQQKNEARRMGEEAGTKLLAPLFLMLIVVMVIIMIPAMMAMG